MLDDTTLDSAMKIGELAEKANLSSRTIRHYGDVGLLVPSGRSEGGFRLYTASDLTRAVLIRRMKALGFALDEMVNLLTVIDTLHQLDSESDGAIMWTELDRFLAEAIARRAKLEDYLRRGDELIEMLSDLSDRRHDRR